MRRSTTGALVVAHVAGPAGTPACGRPPLHVVAGSLELRHAVTPDASAEGNAALRLIAPGESSGPLTLRVGRIEAVQDTRIVEGPELVRIEVTRRDASNVYDALVLDEEGRVFGPTVEFEPTLCIRGSSPDPALEWRTADSGDAPSLGDAAFVFHNQCDREVILPLTVREAPTLAGMVVIPAGGQHWPSP